MRKTDAKHEPAQDASGGPAAYISPDGRRAAGKALRDVTTRVAHGGCKPPKNRRDPFELLRESNEGRIPELIPIRFCRMAQSPFAFYRGAAALMVADLVTAVYVVVIAFAVLPHVAFLARCPVLFSSGGKMARPTG
jgi:hypothetical protein